MCKDIWYNTLVSGVWYSVFKHKLYTLWSKDNAHAELVVRMHLNFQRWRHMHGEHKTEWELSSIRVVISCFDKVNYFRGFNMHERKERGRNFESVRDIS